MCVTGVNWKVKFLSACNNSFEILIHPIPKTSQNLLKNLNFLPSKNRPFLFPKFCFFINKFIIYIKVYFSVILGFLVVFMKLWRRGVKEWFGFFFGFWWWFILGLGMDLFGFVEDLYRILKELGNVVMLKEKWILREGWFLGWISAGYFYCFDLMHFGEENMSCIKI